MNELVGVDFVCQEHADKVDCFKISNTGANTDFPSSINVETPVANTADMTMVGDVTFETTQSEMNAAGVTY